MVGPLARDVSGWLAAQALHVLEAQHQTAWAQLMDLAAQLEREYRRPVDFEFELAGDAVRATRLRTARMQPLAYIAAIHELVDAGILSPAEAVLAVTPWQVAACLTSRVTVTTASGLLGEGRGVSPGAAVGPVVFSASEATALVAGKRGILVVDDLRPEDVALRDHLAGVVALRGGATSHAAVVAKGVGLPMVAGLQGAALDSAAGTLRVGDQTISRLDLVTIDGNTGRLVLGEAVVTAASMTPALAELVEWADGTRTLQVHANADSAEQVTTAKTLGAAGIGLCRLEHALANAGGTAELRRVFAAREPAARKDAVESLTHRLATHLTGMLLAADGMPVAIRLLDVPRHELADRKAGTTESDPMMGTRGVRDFLITADLAVAQVTAIARSCEDAAKQDLRPNVQILVPMVAFVEEFRQAREIIEHAFAQEAPTLALPAVGCMIEVPRIALCAAELAEHADFLAIGSNDLTQFTLAASRDDAEASFLHAYTHEQIMADNPFARLDRAGVGRLLQLCITEARSRRPSILIGLCGNHAAEPESIRELSSMGLTSLSCPSQQVPLARFRAGQAALRP